MNELNKIKIWEELKCYVGKIKDPKTKKMYYKAFLMKFFKNFNFNPDNRTNIKQTNETQLDDWEKEFVEDIKKSQIYEIDTRVEKRKKTQKEAKARMKDFILKGGNLCDISEDIRTETIKKLYYDCLFEYGDEIMEDADRFIKK